VDRTTPITYTRQWRRCDSAGMTVSGAAHGTYPSSGGVAQVPGDALEDGDALTVTTDVAPSAELLVRVRHGDQVRRLRFAAKDLPNGRHRLRVRHVGSGGARSFALTRPDGRQVAPVAQGGLAIGRRVGFALAFAGFALGMWVVVWLAFGDPPPGGGYDFAEYKRGLASAFSALTVLTLVPGLSVSPARRQVLSGLGIVVVLNAVACWLVDIAFHVPSSEDGGPAQVSRLAGAGICVVVAMWLARV
jgi:hypothetical protein